MRSGARWCPTALILLMGLLPAAVAAQPAPGTLDPTFGGGVQIFRPFYFLDDGTVEYRDAEARDVAVDAFGRVVVVGRTRLADWNAAVVVYHRHGRRLAVVEAAFAPASHDVASAVAVQPDGRVVIAGSTRLTTGGLPAVAVARYELQDPPVLDTEFGFGGQRLIYLPGGAEAAEIALEPDGGILLAGVTGEGAVGTGRDAVVVRLTAAGALDATFGSGGVVRLTMNGQQQATGIALAPGGRILLAARSEAADMLLFRLDANGALDDTFGSFGVVVGSNRPADALVLQPDGRMVVPGAAYVNGVSHLAAARYRSSGSADPAFAQGGVVRSEHTGGGADAVVEESGRVVVAGSAVLEAGPEPYLWALGPDGVPDASFAPEPLGRWAAFNAIVRQADGRLVAVGNENVVGGGQRMVIARYVGDTPDVIFEDDFEDYLFAWSTYSGLLGTTAAAGTLSWDEFESRREMAIGP